jgi:chromosome segregation ATPase
MLKKVLVFTGIVAGLGFLLLGTGFGSYVSTGLGVASSKVQEAIPVEFEIKRAESLIDGIIPEIQACKKVVAQEEVEMEYLRSDITQIDKTQEKSLDKIRLQQAALKRGDEQYFFGGKPYTRAQVETDLEKTFETHKSSETLLESKKRLLAAREKSVEAARARLEQVKADKDKAETMLQNLVAQMRQVQAMEAVGNKFTIDGSKLAQAKDLLARCQKRLDVAQRMIEEDAVAADTIPVDMPGARNIVEEVDAYFARTDATPPAAADAKVVVAKTPKK